MKFISKGSKLRFLKLAVLMVLLNSLYTIVCIYMLLNHAYAQTHPGYLYLGLFILNAYFLCVLPSLVNTIAQAPLDDNLRFHKMILETEPPRHPKYLDALKNTIAAYEFQQKYGVYLSEPECRNLFIDMYRSVYPLSAFVMKCLAPFLRFDKGQFIGLYYSQMALLSVMAVFFIGISLYLGVPIVALIVFVGISIGAGFLFNKKKYFEPFIGQDYSKVASHIMP